MASEMKKINCGLLMLVLYPMQTVWADVSLKQTEQTNIDMFATLDVAYGSGTHTLPPNQYSPTSIMPWVTGGIKDYGQLSGSRTDFFNGGLSTSYVGVKGQTQLSSGYRALFKLDSAINPINLQLTDQAHAEAMNGGMKTPQTAYATSSLNGELFAREAYFGFAHEDFGQLSVGRNNNFILDVMNGYAPLNKANLLTPFGNGVLGGGGGISENARLENSIKYTGRKNAFNYGFEYSAGNGGGTLLGLGHAGQYGGSGWALNAGYGNDLYSIQWVSESFKGLLKTAPASALSAADNPLHYNSISLTAYNQSADVLAFKFTPIQGLTLQTGIEKMKLSAANSSNLASITSIYNESVASAINYNGSDQIFLINYAGADYSFNESWNIGYAHMTAKMSSWSGFTNSSSSSFAGGELKSQTLLLINHWNKSTDLYAGMMTTNYAGPAFASGYITTNTVQVVGVRYKL
jgi:predicted porin